MEAFFDGENLPWFVEDLKPLVQIEESLRERGRSAEWIQSQSSGYMLAWVLFIQSQLWVCLYRMTSINIGGVYYLQETKKLLDLMSEILGLATKLKIWLQRTETERTLFPFTSAILRGGHFWVLQQVLYLKYDYRLLSYKGWEFSRIRFESQMLPWQLGWLHSSPEVIQSIARLLNT